ncbi:copper transporter [Demequina litorisediminis]|uniref:copper transporter n=1 Tax=Demequina litorisediminis TaxID=1849022 RepID=UPI0024E16362|nr:copper transporter [Demequina litorisediminis]
MKDFRYHVVSLTAVFLALAIGIVMGSGPMRTALVGEQDERIAQARRGPGRCAGRRGGPA